MFALTAILLSLGACTASTSLSKATNGIGCQKAAGLEVLKECEGPIKWTFYGKNLTPFQESFSWFGVAVDFVIPIAGTVFALVVSGCMGNLLALLWFVTYVILNVLILNAFVIFLTFAYYVRKPSTFICMIISASILAGLVATEVLLHNKLSDAAEYDEFVKKLENALNDLNEITPMQISEDDMVLEQGYKGKISIKEDALLEDFSKSSEIQLALAHLNPEQNP